MKKRTNQGGEMIDTKKWGEKRQFGDKVSIEMKRYGVENEHYIHKVIGILRSNTWVDVPVQTPATETIHGEVEDVVACVCEGIEERGILRYRVSDTKLVRSLLLQTQLETLEMVKGMKKQLNYGQDSKSESLVIDNPVFAVITWNTDDGREWSEITPTMENYELSKYISFFMSSTLQGREASSVIYDAKEIRWSDIAKELDQCPSRPDNEKDEGYNQALSDVCQIIKAKMEGKIVDTNTNRPCKLCGKNIVAGRKSCVNVCEECVVLGRTSPIKQLKVKMEEKK